MDSPRRFALSLEDDLLEQRLRRIREIEALGFRASGQRFEFTHTIPGIITEYSAKTAEELEPLVTVRTAERIEPTRGSATAGLAHRSQAGTRLHVSRQKD